MTAPTRSEERARRFFGCEPGEPPAAEDGFIHSRTCEVYMDGIDHPSPEWGCESLASAFSEVRREENAEWCAALDFLAGMAGRDRSQDLARLIEWNDKRREALRSEGGA